MNDVGLFFFWHIKKNSGQNILSPIFNRNFNWYLKTNLFQMFLGKQSLLTYQSLFCFWLLIYLPEKRDQNYDVNICFTCGGLDKYFTTKCMISLNHLYHSPSLHVNSWNYIVPQSFPLIFFNVCLKCILTKSLCNIFLEKRIL